MIIWALGIAGSVALLAISAGGRGLDLRMAYVHMAIAAFVSIFIALTAIREARALHAQNASRSEIAASSARFMGLVWTWGALALVVTYGSGILSWHEWWQFFLAFFVAAGLCLFFSATLKKDADIKKDDETMLKLGHYLAVFQLIGMTIVIAGLLLDGKMTRFSAPRPGWEDWAANNIFFFGAVALVAISLVALIGRARRPDGRPTGSTYGKSS